MSVVYNDCVQNQLVWPLLCACAAGPVLLVLLGVHMGVRGQFQSGVKLVWHIQAEIDLA